MRNRFLIFIFSALAFSAKAQFPSADTSYFYLFGGEQADEFREVQNVQEDSGYVALGTTASFTNGFGDFYLVKTDWRGNTLWARNIGTTGIESGYSVKQTPDKGFILGGLTNNSLNGDYDMYLVKTDSFGWKQWEKKIGGADWDFLYSVAVMPDSGFVLCGETYSYGNGTGEVYVVRTDKNGDTLWTRFYGGPNHDCGKKVRVTYDTCIIVCGFTESFGAGMRDAYLLKLKGNGDTLFTRTFGGANNEEFNDLIEHQLDSGYVAVGYAESFTAELDKDVYYIKTNKNGLFIWDEYFGHSTGEDIGYSVAELQFNNLWLNFSTAYGAGKSDCGEVITNNAGVGFWGLFNTNYGDAEEDIPYSSVLTKRNDYLVAGTTQSFGRLNGDAFLLLNDSILYQSMQNSVTVSSDSLVSVKEVWTSFFSGTVFPNPGHGNFVVSGLGANDYKISVTDILGNSYYLSEEQPQFGGKIFLNLTNLSVGVYLLQLESGKERASFRLVIIP